MRNLFNIIYLAIIAVVISSCGEKDIIINEYTREPGNEAQVRFYNFGINAPSVNFYADNVKITASQSLTGEMAPTGVSFGATYPSIGYVEVPGGDNINIFSKTPTTLAIPANNVNNYQQDKEVSNITVPKLESKKQYSLFIAGYFDKDTHKAESFIISDELPPSDTSKVFVRFVNSGVAEAGTLSIKVSKMDGTEVISEEMVAAELAFKSATEFKDFPYGTYKFTIIPSNANNRIWERTITLNRDRVHTIAVRGDLRNTSPAPLLDNTQNR